jgi:hypothetical protein
MLRNLCGSLSEPERRLENDYRDRLLGNSARNLLAIVQTCRGIVYQVIAGKLIDRLLYNATVLNIPSTSYRLRGSQFQQERGAFARRVSATPLHDSCGLT